MIFDALSNAAYRVSLRGPGAEIEGGFSTTTTTTPPAGGGKSRGPAGRGLKLCLFEENVIHSKISVYCPRAAF